MYARPLFVVVGIFGLFWSFLTRFFAIALWFPLGFPLGFPLASPDAIGYTLAA
jgi:hypothetical protein